jgi:hypothetical protein
VTNPAARIPSTIAITMTILRARGVMTLHARHA